jgi:hypothetical protein
MLLITGEIERVTTREAGNPGNTWTETTLVVRDWGQTLYATVGKDFGPVPVEGDRVALEVSVRSYVSRKRAGEAGHGYTAHRRNSEAEAALFRSSAVKA